MNEVTPRLWMGATPDPTAPHAKFDAIILCAKEIQPVMRKFKGTVIRAPFREAPYPTARERKIAIRAAREVVKRLRKGQTVLVTCGEGLNRSGLVVGLSLRMATKKSPGEIIHLIRRARGEWALRNDSFLRIICGFASRDLPRGRDRGPR